MKISGSIIEMDIGVPRTLESPPHISPVKPGVSRPLWSVMIPAYNCYAYLVNALNSVLLQAPEEEKMEIIVVDDASTDEDVKALVDRIGNGRVKYFRQKENVGSLRNFETCLNLSTGHLIHLLHGDDEVMPGYYKKIEELFSKFPHIGAAATATEYFFDDDFRSVVRDHEEKDEETLLPDFFKTQALSNRLQYCSVTVKRQVYEALGGFYGAHYGEDWEMWARIAKHYEIAYSAKYLARYRSEHRASITSASFLSGNNLRDVYTISHNISKLMPEEERKSFLQQTQIRYVLWSLHVAYNWWLMNKGRKQETYAYFNTVKGFTNNNEVRNIVNRLSRNIVMFELKMRVLAPFRKL